jgi:type II secretory pathway pseudopilin PulG
VTFRTFLTNTAQREDGLTLIEVVVTTLLVALIAVGTLTGFQDIDHVSADERFHDEAALLAAQSQEQLRSDPASTLNGLVGASKQTHTYITKVDGNIYTVTQGASYYNESKPGSDCLATSASESSAKGDGDYIRVTSTVTWPQLRAASRQAVSESSIITPPDGSALEVDATNGGSPEQALPGVTSVVKYTGVEAPEATTLEGTTGTAGCVVFGGIPATSAKVEINELANYVTTSGALKVPTKEVTIAPNITTHDPVILGEGGAIMAKFMYTPSSGPESSTYTHEGKVENVTGDTFVASFEEATSANEFTVGGTKFEYQTSGEHKYKALTGTYSASGTTPMGSSYSKGDLFPFPSTATKKYWVVYAGDCKENNANSIDSAVADGKATVFPGQTAGQTTPEEVKVPMTYLQVNVYTGTKSTPGSLATTTYKVKITNIACEKAPTPINASAANLIHEQNTTSTGHLTDPFMPFGKAKLCLANTSENHIFTIEPNLNEPAEHSDTIYLKEKTGEYTSPTSSDKVKVSTASSC